MVERRAAYIARSSSGQSQAIAGYIAGMTDRFELQKHKVLTDPQARA